LLGSRATRAVGASRDPGAGGVLPPLVGGGRSRARELRRRDDRIRRVEWRAAYALRRLLRSRLRSECGRDAEGQPGGAGGSGARRAVRGRTTPAGVPADLRAHAGGAELPLRPGARFELPGAAAHVEQALPCTAPPGGRPARPLGKPRVAVPEPTGCAWAGTEPAMVAYHDDEWGVPTHDD